MSRNVITLGLYDRDCVGLPSWATLESSFQSVEQSRGILLSDPFDADVRGKVGPRIIEGERESEREREREREIKEKNRDTIRDSGIIRSVLRDSSGERVWHKGQRLRMFWVTWKGGVAFAWLLGSLPGGA